MPCSCLSYSLLPQKLQFKRHKFNNTRGVWHINVHIEIDSIWPGGQSSGAQIRVRGAASNHSLYSTLPCSGDKPCFSLAPCLSYSLFPALPFCFRPCLSLFPALPCLSYSLSQALHMFSLLILIACFRPCTCCPRLCPCCFALA